MKHISREEKLWAKDIEDKFDLKNSVHNVYTVDTEEDIVDVLRKAGFGVVEGAEAVKRKIYNTYYER